MPTASGSAVAATIEIERNKKASSNSTLDSFSTQQIQDYKKDGFAVAQEKTNSIDDYPAKDRLFTLEQQSRREIIFATRNYFYVITITPGQSELNAVVDELIKTIAII